MRHFTPNEPTFPATDFAATQDADTSPPMTLSALRMTREAIARWTGGTLAPAAVPRDVVRVSPQARWVAKTQQDLAAWIECGGFSQIADGSNAFAAPPLTTPVMYDISRRKGAQEADWNVTVSGMGGLECS